MKIYIDLFFMFNLIIDVIIIMGTSILLKRKTSIIRIIIASTIGSIASLFLFTNIDKIFIEIISIIIMSLISFGYRSLIYTIRNILYIYLLSTLLGGLLYLFNIKIDNSFLYYGVVIIISTEVTILYVKELKKIKNNYNNYYNVSIYFDEDILSLVGFVDTGNNLYDPYKHRPIILVNKKYEKGDKYILVPYHTLSGDGLLKCIKPKYICINNQIINNVLIGFSDNINLIDGVDVILHKKVMKGE